ncbi:MAG: PCMD domain-containing protein [Bacteroidales bacterium]
MYRKFLFILIAALQITNIIAAEREVLLKYGDMEQWFTRIISESGIIGGDEKTLYEIAPEGENTENEPYYNLGGSQWATSNVMAKVAGITKTNSSVSPFELDGGGKVAHLVTRIEKVKVLGIINISVIAAGSIFQGSVVEPITGTKDPHKYLNSGIEFSERPKALRFDYKIQLSGEPNRIRMTGFSSTKTIEGIDMPTAILLLQKRWEDNDGNIYASRIGTIVINYTQDSDWVKDATYQIIYGDATKSPDYTPNMNIGHEERYAINSQGENVPVTEVSWADADETPTHMILHFASSHGGAYIGSPGTQMWLDNIRLVY